MSQSPRQLRALITNDDGWMAEGLHALESALHDLASVWVLAPDQAYSGCSHRVTAHGAIAFRSIRPGVAVIAGTPADCVRLGLGHFAAEPDWIFSGINHGANLGYDVYYSGTVAAVREGAFHGIRGLAISQYFEPSRPLDWTASARWARRVLDLLLPIPLEPAQFWNVNLPHLEPGTEDPEIVFCQVDRSRPMLRYVLEQDRLLERGIYQERPRIPGQDVDVCLGGRIAVSRLSAVPDALAC